MDLAGGGVGAQAGAHDDARIVDPAIMRDIVWFGVPIRHQDYRVLDTRRKTAPCRTTETRVTAECRNISTLHSLKAH